MLNETQSIHSVIDHCRTVERDLRNIANFAEDWTAKDELTKALQSVDVCIKQCESALHHSR